MALQFTKDLVAEAMMKGNPAIVVVKSNKNRADRGSSISPNKKGKRGV